MKRLAIALFLSVPTLNAFAGDRVLDLSGGCKIYKLQSKKWVPTDPASLEGASIPENQILRDETFTVFKTSSGTFGVSQRCVRDAAETPRPAPPRVGRRRSAAPTPQRGDTKSDWAVVFGLGYNLSANANVINTDTGTTQTATLKYTSTVSFLGEANYRLNSAFRIAGELGLSQLQVDSQSGNETSFFDVRPEFIFRASPKVEIYIGPMLGIFFFSQNTYSFVNAIDETISIKQQTSTVSLLGLSLGADYALNSQFDLGFFVRYFKPGEFKLTGTNTFTSGNFESKISTSYMASGFRFAIHF